jgi:hypothetical protein
LLPEKQASGHHVPACPVCQARIGIAANSVDAGYQTEVHQAIVVSMLSFLQDSRSASDYLLAHYPEVQSQFRIAGHYLLLYCFRRVSGPLYLLFA